MSTSRRGLTLAAASVFALTLAAGSAEAQTLADAVALAYQTNPVLQSQRALLRSADEAYVQSRSNLRPQAELGGQYAYSRNDRDQEGFGGGDGDYDSDRINLSASATQNLYTGGRITADIRSTQADILANREQLRGVESNVLLNVIQFYVDVRRDFSGLQIRENNVAVLRRQLEETRARFEVGEITRTDVAQAEARLAQAEALYSSAQAGLAISRANYTAVVGEAPADLAPEPPLPGLPDTIGEAFAIGEAESPLIRTAEFQEQAANARVALARAQYRPTVSLAAEGVSQGTEARSFVAFTNSVNLVARASIPLFTGGLNDSRVRQALEQENAARITVETRRREVNQQVTAAWNQLLAARAQLISNQEQVRAATVAFQGVQEEQRVGLRTTLDVLNAEQELRNAELFLVQSRRDAYVAGASVLQAMGRLEARDLVTGVPIYDSSANFEAIRREGQVPWEGLVQRIDSIGSPRTVVPRRIEVPNALPEETAPVATAGTVWVSDPNSSGPIPERSNIPAAAPFRSSAEPGAPGIRPSNTPGVDPGPMYRAPLGAPIRQGTTTTTTTRSVTSTGPASPSMTPVPNPGRR